MQLEPPGTPEQKFCGAWYRCTRCTSRVLLPGEDLRRQLTSLNQHALGEAS